MVVKLQNVSKSAFGPAYHEDMKGFQKHRGVSLSRLEGVEDEATKKLLEHLAEERAFVSTKSPGSFAHEGHVYRWNSNIRSYEVGFGATKAFVSMNKCRSNATLTGDRFKMPESQTFGVSMESQYLFDTVARLWCKTFGFHLRDFKKTTGIKHLSDLAPQMVVGMIQELEEVASEINGIAVPVPRFNLQWTGVLKARIARGQYYKQQDRTLQKRVNKAAHEERNTNAPAMKAADPKPMAVIPDA